MSCTNRMCLTNGGTVIVLYQVIVAEPQESSPDAPLCPTNAVNTMKRGLKTARTSYFPISSSFHLTYSYYFQVNSTSGTRIKVISML